MPNEDFSVPRPRPRFTPEQHLRARLARARRFERYTLGGICLLSLAGFLARLIGFDGLAVWSATGIVLVAVARLTLQPAPEQPDE